MQRIELPLLHDHHSHGSLYAALGGCPDLSGLAFDEARSLLASLPEDRLTLVTGYRSGVHRLEKSELDALPPALVADFSLHGFLCTGRALPLLRETFPEIAVHRDDRPWMERNIARLFSLYVKFAGLDEAKLAEFFRRLESVGTGSTEDMSASAEALRLIAATPFRDRFALWVSPEEEARLFPEERPLVRGIKLYLDGSLGSRTAAIEGRFDDGSEGFLTCSDEALSELVFRYGRNYDLSLHAIGERAIAQALTCLARLGRGGLGRRGVRLEHVQFITKDQAWAAKDLGLVLSMQPNFTEDSVLYADRLDPERRAANNPFRMLLDEVGFKAGEDLVFGSDGMPHGAAHAFRWSLFPPYPGQTLGVDELVAGYGVACGKSGTISLKVDERNATVELVPALGDDS